MSIIALLAAVAIPAFSAALESARRAKCAGNLRQIGIGFQQYANDNDQNYPVVYNSNAPSDSLYWYNSVATALGQDPSSAWVKGGWFDCPDSTNGVPGYTMSWAVSGVKTVNIHTTQLLAADGPGASGAGFNATPPYGGIDLTRHRGGANFLYVDGHVEYSQAVDTNSITP